MMMKNQFIRTYEAGLTGRIKPVLLNGTDAHDRSPCSRRRRILDKISLKQTDL